MLKRLSALIPEHKVYVEAFGGSGALLFAKTPAPLDVYNDIHQGLVTFYRTVRDPELYQKLQMRLELSPYSRDDYVACKGDAWKSIEDPVERAATWFVSVRQAYSSCPGRGWSYSRPKSAEVKFTSRTQDWLKAIALLPEIHERLMLVQIEDLPWETLLDRYDGKDTFFYLDPPYVLETREGGAVYEHEFDLDEHHRLIQRLLSVEGKVLLSGYMHDSYSSLEANGWKIVQWGDHARAGTKKWTPRTETCWMNYEVNHE